MFVPGLEMGNALVDLLFGDVSPSGKLPITLPNKDNEVGFTPKQFPGVNASKSDGYLTSNYSEGLLVGYRWYDHTHTVRAVHRYLHTHARARALSLSLSLTIAPCTM